MSKSEHPHAEFFRAIADGGYIVNWECRHSLNSPNRYREMTGETIGMAYGNPEDWVIRRKPTPKVIDWSQLGRHVPVAVGDFGKPRLSFLAKYNRTNYPFVTTCGANYKNCTLDTGLWVANHDGVNPWPDGCVVEFWVRCEETAPPSDCPTPAHGLRWTQKGQKGDIIMSRFHSLEDGYSFGGES